MTNYWFKRKRYGWGWVPANWKGWLILAMYVGLVLLGALFFGRKGDQPTGEDTLVFVTTFMVATGMLLSITHYTAPKPRWRWGKKPTDNPSEDA